MSENVGGFNGIHKILNNVKLMKKIIAAHCSVIFIRPYSPSLQSHVVHNCTHIFENSMVHNLSLVCQATSISRAHNASGVTVPHRKPVPLALI